MLQTYMQIESQTMLLFDVAVLLIVSRDHMKIEWPDFAHICIKESPHCVPSSLAV